MLEPAAGDERGRLDQGIDDRSIGVAGFPLVGDDALAFEARRLFGEGAVLVDRVGNAGVDSTLLQEPRARGPELEILAAMAGRGMNEACARVFSDVVAVEQGNDKPVAVGVQRMGADHRRQRVAVDPAKELE